MSKRHDEVIGLDILRESVGPSAESERGMGCDGRRGPPNAAPPASGIYVDSTKIRSLTQESGLLINNMKMTRRTRGALDLSPTKGLKGYIQQRGEKFRRCLAVTAVLQ